METGRQEVDMGDRELKYCLFVDKCNYINSTCLWHLTCTVVPRHTLGLRWEFITCAKKIFR